MQNDESLAQRRLGAVIAAISSEEVAPGSGSAAAVGLALAAACAGKAVSITLKHRSHDAELARARQWLHELADRALRSADEDAARFREFVREKDALAAQELVEAGTRLQRRGAALLTALDHLDDRMEPQVRGDLAAARALCQAFSEIQSANVADNRDAAGRSEDV